jgi:hypothetical protein
MGIFYSVLVVRAWIEFVISNLKWAPEQSIGHLSVAFDLCSMKAICAGLIEMRIRGCVM